ncbi:MAG: hypothetical protein MUO59_07980 [Actinobacteria bacterium]|nr:hypothetical protein [Actinomycetota bacterium]
MCCFIFYGKSHSSSAGNTIESIHVFISSISRRCPGPVEKLDHSETGSLKDRITRLSRVAGYLPARDEIIDGASGLPVYWMSDLPYKRIWIYLKMDRFMLSYSKFRNR